MSMKRFDFTESVPLRYDRDNVIRVTGSRITLYTVVTCYKMGDTADDIQDGFPSLTLEQINAIIGWYLDNKTEVDEYIKDVEAKAEKLWQDIESRPENIAFREKIRSLRGQLIKS